MHRIIATLDYRIVTSDVKRGQNLEADAEARATRPRRRLRPRPKIIMKKSTK